MKEISLNVSGGNLDSDRCKYSEGVINFEVEKCDKLHFFTFTFHGTGGE